ncbi:MAG: ABC transporter permease [Anaerolineaceae bacterium]|jgi:putative ABC transport system permease protein
MKFLQALKEAVVSLNANRSRSFLTILGIVIGVGAVIGLMAIGQGAQSTITGEIESIGTNVIYIMSGNFLEEVTNARRLTLADAEALSNRSRAPHILRVEPVVQGYAEVAHSGESLNADIVGVSDHYNQTMNLELAEGSFITSSHVDSRAAVVVVGPELAERLTGKRSGVVGTVIRVKDYPTRIIGVLVSKGGGQFNNPDMFAYMPISTVQLRIRQSDASNQVTYIVVQATDSQSVEDAITEANMVMREAHRLSPRQKNDFTITNQEDFLSIANSVTSVLTVFLSGIAAISLLVGGIGIMNIMLVSVTERTREIGLRKALGARKSDIMLQFLSESAMLSLIGGLLGIGLGWLLAAIVSAIASSSGTQLNPEIGLNAILLATLFSTAVGLFFGWYPASRAAKLEPVEALRYE